MTRQRRRRLGEDYSRIATRMKEEKLVEDVEIPEKVEIKVEGPTITAKGEKGEASRRLFHPKISIVVESGKVILAAKKATQREKRMLGTYVSHIKNLVRGCTEGFVYKLKVCSGHFPMNVALSGNEFSVKNFLGEKVPRILQIKEGVDVKVEGEEITVESADKELAGNVAAAIERLTTVKNKDLRIFQDGIYITEKAGKPVR